MVNKPRILIIGPRGLFGCEGGIEKFADAFIPRALKTANITVLCVIAPEKKLPPGLEVIVVPRVNWLKTDKIAYLFYSIFIHSIRKFDHIFIFGTNLSILIPLLRTIFWKKAKIHLRSGSIDHRQAKWGPVMRLFMRTTEKLSKYADTVISVAPSIQTHLLSLGVKSFVIRNGIENEDRSLIAKPKIPNSVLAVGRISPPKNYGILIKASEIMGEEGPNITVIGGADLSQEMSHLQNLLTENNTKKVHLAGAQNREKVMEALKTHALFINCSVQEGMSNAVLEAIQQGIPIILSNIDANKDLGLADHFYFNPNDELELANKIMDALNYPQNYIASKGNFEHWDVVVDKILKITKVAT